MTRHEMREQTFKELFLREFHDQDEYTAECHTYLESQEELSQEDRDFLEARAAAVAEKIPELDEKLNEASIGWKTSRMGKVDLAILRLALYEILYDDGVPEKVAINEAVELAKQYGSDDSPSFINGVLGKLVRS